MLRMFNESLVASAILFAVVCWGSRLQIVDTNRFNKQQGQWLCGGGDGLAGGGVIEEVDVQVMCDIGQSPTPTP